MVKPTTVKGKKDKHAVMLYALSTCIWCKKTRKLLDDLGAGYDYVYVDLLTGKDEEEAMAEVRKHNPQCTFPLVIIDGSTAIVGFREPDITKALK